MATDSNKGANGKDDDPSHISYESDDGPVFAGSMTGEDVDFDPEPEERFRVPKSKEPKQYKRVHGAGLRFILKEKDPKVLKAFIKKHIETLCWADEIRKDLMDILKNFAPANTKFSDDMEPGTLLEILKDILENYQRKLVMLDMTLEGTELLEGTALKFKIEESTKKIGELLESYQLRMNEAELNTEMLLDIIKEKMNVIHHYESKIDQLYNALLNLKGRDFDESTPTAEEFFEELKKHLEKDLHLNSSLKEELAEEKQRKHFLYQEICKLKEDNILIEEDKMKELAELARDFQLEEGIKGAILEKINTLSANKEEVRKAVEDWMQKISSSIADKEGEIQKLKEALKDREDQITSLKAEINEASENYYQLGNEITDMEREIEQKLEIFNAKQKQIEDLDNGLYELDSKIRSRTLSPTRYYDAESALESMMQSSSSVPESYYSAAMTPTGHPEVMQDFYDERSHSRPGSPELSHSTPKSETHSPELINKSFSGSLRDPREKTELNLSSYKDISSSDKLSDSTQQRLRLPEKDDLSTYSLSFDESPEKLRLESPCHRRMYFDDSSPMSIDSTPRSTSPPYSVTPPSPFRMSSPLIQSYDETAVPRGPGTVAIPGPSRKITHITETIDSNSGNRVSNRFDIGKSVNLRTECKTSSPCHQVTRVQSFIPDSGYSGQIADHPLQITQSVEMTPTQFETPFISQSRFGYTDPTARILNMPPDLESFKVDTPSQQEQGISPDVETYGIPPAVTPTTTRRHGLFTPKGIFRKKHYNLRRIFDSPELPFSPQYLHERSRSPEFPSPFSHPYSDKSISWEEKYEHPHDEYIRDKTFRASPVMDRTFDATTSHAINRTFDAASPCAMDRTFDRSPASAMDRTFHASSPYARNRTFDRSASPMDRKFDASSPYSMNRTFDRSPASPMDKKVRASSPSAMNKTFDRSPAFVMDRTFDTSSPHAMNRTFDRSPAPPMDRKFHASSPSAMNKTFDRSPVFAMDRTFDASSPYAMNRTFDRSTTSAMDRRYDVSSPSSMNKTFDRPPTSIMSRTFVSSSPQGINKTFDASPSYTMNKTFNRPLLSPLGKTFQQSPSTAISPHAVNRTFHRSPVSNMDRTFDASSPHTINRTFDTSSPHALNTTFDVPSDRAFNKSVASPIERSFQQRTSAPSSPYGRTFDASSPQLLNGTFDKSSPHPLNTTFGTSPSYATNRTFNKSRSSPLGRTFQQSPSPNLNRTYPQSDFDRTFNKSNSPMLNKSYNKSQ